MPTYFPQLGSIIAQKGSSGGLSFRTSLVEVAGGQHFARAEQDSPLFQATLVYPSLSDASLSTLEAFFADREGRLKPFTFLDPDGNLLSYSEDFSNAYWTKTAVGLAAGAADPFGGTRAMIATGSASNSALSAVFCPDGGLAGYTFCFSAWLRAAAAGTVRIGFDDGGAALTQVAISARYARVSATRTLSGAGAPKAVLEVGAQSVSVFGMQVVPMSGPGGYARTPGAPGVVPNCRFDADDMEIRAIGPNQWATRLTVRQFVP